MPSVGRVFSVMGETHNNNNFKNNNSNNLFKYSKVIALSGPPVATRRLQRSRNGRHVISSALELASYSIKKRRTVWLASRR